MHPALRWVSERLPHLRDLAALLFESDEVFRELCDECRICCQAAIRLEGARGADEAIHKEYEALRLRLEGELLRYVSERPDA
jgi:hypothetical protein